MKTVNRLYEQFQPAHYDLSLELQREARTFSGTVTITGRTADKTAIPLHAKGLVIESAALNGQSVTWNAGDDDEVYFTAPQHISQEISLSVTFRGSISDGMHGLYPCYFEHDGTQKELLATQLESHHAREVFPCVDEPEAKATFDLTLTTEKDMTVLGNMPISAQDEQGGRLITTFETTPRMSTYLLAFAVGELQSKEARTKDGVLVRIFATQEQPAASLDFALDTAVRSIEFFNDYFGTPYPLPKSDHIALPDFSSGAMENWGLITYRETTLLVDPDNTAIPVKEYVATVIAHELSHQWFGNLVTMRWWNDLWLNESFATLMEYVAVDALYPEWNAWLNFASAESLSAQRRDALPGVQSVRTAVNHPDEIGTLFDPSIVYAKGAKLLQMLRAYIGEDAFRQGLREYFKVHAYKNTAGSDLWNALGLASGKDLEAFMTAWLDKPGYPLVSVTNKNGKLMLSQRRLLTIKPERADTSLWPAPINGEGSLDDALLDSETADFDSSVPYPKLNMQDQSFFVTRYKDPAHKQSLRDRIESQDLTAIDRLQLLNESQLLARAGEESLADTLELTQAYRNETSEPVWSIIAGVIAESRRLLEEDEEATAKLRAYVRSFVRPVYQKLGWEEHKGDSDEVKKLRSLVIALAVWSEDTEALGIALDRFKAFTKPSDLPADLRTIVYSAGAKHGGMEAFEKLLALHQSTSSSEERNNLYSGMTSARDPEVIQRELSLLTDKSVVRLQDLDHWFVYLIRNVHARQATWDWMVSNWGWIEQKFKSDKSYDNFVRYAASTLQGDIWLQRFVDFFGPKKEQVALRRVIEIGINDIRARTDFLNRDAATLRQYLESTEKR